MVSILAHHKAIVIKLDVPDLRSGKIWFLTLPLNRVRASASGRDNLYQTSSCPGADGAQNYGDVMNEGELTPNLHPHSSGESP